MIRVALIYLAILTGFLNLFLQVPLTPVHARQLTPDLGWVALAVSAYSVTNLAGNLLAGFLIDRIPKGVAIAGGLALGALGLALASGATQI